MIPSFLIRAFGPAGTKTAAGLGGIQRARGGNVAVIVGLSIPALATLMFGAVDVTSIFSDRDRMQSIADSAALSGARNLSVAMRDSSALENARAMAAAMIAEWRDAPALTVTAEVVQQAHGGQGVHVVLDARRPSLFGDLLPPGGWQYAVDATAASVGSMPLCILTTSDAVNGKFDVGGTAEIRAPDCLLHGNGDLSVGGGRIEAGQTEAVGSATGDITPAPITDAPVIPDPFADRTQAAALPCLSSLRGAVMLINTGTHTLPAGRHCGVINVSGDANLVLAPGEHYFQIGAVLVSQSARVTGNDVVLIFDGTSFFNLLGDSVINISGRESGVYAGFAVMAARGNVRTFTIDSTHVERLDGVLYVPDATLRVSGQSDVARQSDWTVIVAKNLVMNGNPRLYLNADYAGSDIDVPQGVGPRPGGARLLD